MTIILLVDKVLYPLGPLNAIYKKPTNAVICQGTSSGLAGFGWKFIHTLQPSEKVCASDCYMASQTYMTRTFFLTENLGWSKMSQLPLGTRGSSYGFCIGCVMLHRSACLRILPFFFFALASLASHICIRTHMGSKGGDRSYQGTEWIKHLAALLPQVFLACSKCRISIGFP